MTSSLTELDRRIIEALKADARVSFRALAKRLGVSTPTISKRVKRLEEAGIIRGYTVVTTPLPEAATQAPPEPLTCAQCRNKIEGRPRLQKLGDAVRVFCCDYCAATYAERFNKAMRDMGKPLLGLVLLTSAVSFGVAGFSCGAPMCGETPAINSPWVRCPVSLPPQDRPSFSRPSRSRGRTRTGAVTASCARKAQTLHRLGRPRARDRLVRIRLPAALRVRR